MNGAPHSEEADKPDNGKEKLPDWRKYVTNAAFTIVGGLFGALVTGYYNLAIQKNKSDAELQIEKTKVDAEIQLEQETFQSSTKMERQKLDEELIRTALQPPEIEKRKEALQFMVETALISDPVIQKGVKEYLAGGKVPPQIAAPTSPATPSSSDTGTRNYKVTVQLLVPSDRQLAWATKLYQDLMRDEAAAYEVKPPKVGEVGQAAQVNKVLFFNPDDAYWASAIVAQLTTHGLKDVSLKISSSRTEPRGYIEIWLFDVPAS